MKIAIVAIGGFDRSGTERIIPCLLWLVEGLVAAGHEVHVFVPAQEDRPGTWPLMGATIHNAGRGKWRLRTMASIAGEHRRARFDVIHAFWATVGAVAAVASKLLKVPMVLTLPGGDTAAIRDIGYGALLSVRGRATLRLAAAAASRVTTPSDCLREQAGQQGIRAVTMPLGVDTRRWPPLAPRPRDNTAPLKLVHVASLNRVKDQPTLLAALRILKTRGRAFELRVIGVDTLGGEIQRLCDLLGLAGEVRFLGGLPHDQVRVHVSWADMLVMASRHEGAPIAFLEAALTGVPTVGTAVGHIADLSPDAAVAAPSANPLALAGAIGALADDEPRRLQVALAAQAFAVRHDAAFTADAFQAIYRQVTG